MAECSTARRPDGAAGASTVVCRASRPGRRRLAALAWIVLEELALSARPDDQGWASVVGVHALPVAIGTTEEAAMCALAALTRAGLVAIESVTDAAGGRRYGDRRRLPDGIALCACLDDEDTAQHVPVRGASERDAGPLKTDRHPGSSRGPQLCPTDRDRLPVTYPHNPEQR